MLLIAIDFDDTLTKDAELWQSFAVLCKQLGHRVICVTARRETEENVAKLEEWMTSHGLRLQVYFTGLKSKVDYMKSLGMNVDIWIDDDPLRCALGH